MKRVILSLMAIATAVTAVVAQPQGGRSQGGRPEGGRPEDGGMQQGGQQMMMAFMQNPMGSMGYFEIDEDDAEKKIKFAKEDRVKADKFEDFIDKYNDSMDDFEDQNEEQIKKVEELKKQLQAARESGDRELVRPLMEGLAPITRDMRAKLQVIHKTLSEDLNSTLTGNELKRWASYYVPLCKKNSYTPRMGQKPQQRKSGNSDNKGSKSSCE